MSQIATYTILGIAIGFEVIGTSLLPMTQQFSRLWPTLGMAACYAVAFFCLSITVQVLPVAIVYAVWSGMGVVLIAMVNYVVFRQVLDLWAVLGLVLIVGGVVIINTLSKSVPH
ncbi:QacE family quaternary ammonium compound efflux SMR transporter [Gemmobacter fulvus]|uniref:QacE family quaternary ammonium compound efflux SMR transporter n=1 Tax=Gemmobacter fulvus TaxID=2840474 RepID=A0A975P630_9RHOB|nr:SMR family transporter [Gemmobacter fulvus]MBT9245354.1 QacE family quaternary ammonium compound efflux SMR transporter [Gemmobacter fulvus]QWK90329.1 QacE family quaternary ammonium compound efflux SMR transporter [Gemmobacter fulvus]